MDRKEPHNAYAIEANRLASSLWLAPVAVIVTSILILAKILCAVLCTVRICLCARALRLHIIYILLWTINVLAIPHVFPIWICTLPLRGRRRHGRRGRRLGSFCRGGSGGWCRRIASFTFVVAAVLTLLHDYVGTFVSGTADG